MVHYLLRKSNQMIQLNHFLYLICCLIIPGAIMGQVSYDGAATAEALNAEHKAILYDAKPDGFSKNKQNGSIAFDPKNVFFNQTYNYSKS